MNAPHQVCQFETLTNKHSLTGTYLNFTESLWKNVDLMFMFIR